MPDPIDLEPGEYRERKPKGWRWRRVTIAAGAWLCAASAIGADFSYLAGRYLCVEQFGGGIGWSNGRWVGTTFRADSQFILSVDYVQQVRSTFVGDEEREGSEFRVELTDLGSDYPNLCWGGGPYGLTHLYFSGAVSCSTAFYSVRLNLDNNRFVRVYNAGYVDGIDDNSNTPSLMGGTCTKFE